MNCICYALAAAAGIALSGFAGAAASDATEPAAAADVVAQLQAMNDADCTTSKAGDWNAFAKTLARGFVEIDVVGKKESRDELVADLKSTSPDGKVDACSTRISKVTGAGNLYFLYGEYSEEGSQGPKHSPYRTLSRIRDTWTRVGNSWLQTESLTYEMTVWVSGRIVEHRVLPSASNAPTNPSSRPIAELKPLATIHVGKTADWVAVTPDAVWVGSTGPFAVNRIDPDTNKLVATVALQGEPCAGLATGFGSLWVPLCGPTPMLAKVDLASNALTSVFKIGPGAAEGSITTSPDSVWLVVDKDGLLARIDPRNGAILKTIRLPAGSHNPRYSDGRIWVTRAGGSEVASVDASTGEIRASTPTGPGPRFLTAGAGAIWTLNQGDGSLTRIDTVGQQLPKTIPLDTPGHGGDIAFSDGRVWTTMSKVPLSLIDATTDTLRCQWKGPGGDSLGIGHGAIWLTDYDGGTISRIDLDDAVKRCDSPAVK